MSIKIPDSPSKEMSPKNEYGVAKVKMKQNLLMDTKLDETSNDQHTVS